MFPRDILKQAERVLDLCENAQLTLTTAESCTGGLIAGCLTSIAGSSLVFEHGFVTYSNRAKQEMLGVEAALLSRHGAVSEAVARAMAQGALRRATADLAVAVTGIAGPGGGTPDKPVGTVHLAVAQGNGTCHHLGLTLDGDRSAIRMATVSAALAELINVLRR